MVTSQLFSAFVFATHLEIVQSLFFLNLKFQDSTVQFVSELVRNSKGNFLDTRLICKWSSERPEACLFSSSYMLRKHLNLAVFCLMTILIIIGTPLKKDTLNTNSCSTGISGGSFQFSKGRQFEPRCEKTGLLGFRPGPTQTGLYSHRRWLEA